MPFTNQEVVVIVAKELVCKDIVSSSSLFDMATSPNVIFFVCDRLTLVATLPVNAMPSEVSRKIAQRERAIVGAFVESAVAGEIDRIDLHSAAVDKAFLWRRAFRAIAKAAEVPQDYRHAFMNSWVRRGDHIRGEVEDDRILFAGLRRLLPAYEGGPVTLYRGDSADNCRRRSYGPSWSSDEGVARSFAEGNWRVSAGGSVLLKTVAPPDAIICAPTLHDASYGEFEYLVERRKLKKVEVVERFAQISHEDYAALCRANSSGRDLTEP
jgi:hypothetical protein